jgi:hypothetical protein
MDFDEYCRQLEAHLCRRNGGHLIRIVGPAFSAVQDWFTKGIPFKVACLGIDRRVDRVTTRGPRRRPVRLEFCDADVQDAFDQWRRAVGLRAADLEPGGSGDPAQDEAPTRGRTSLPAHLDRVMTRLTALRTGPSVSEPWSRALEDATRSVDALQSRARRARGDVRDAITAELTNIDRVLMAAAAREVSADVLAELGAEAEQELVPFRGRLTDADYAEALDRSRVRALRVRLALPTVTCD